MIQFGLLSLLILLILGAGHFLGIWAFLVLMGGIMSYLGDQIGTYFGKKRLSVFGIRPKNTAILFSMLTGTFITLVTLVGAVLISNDYREALTGVQEKKNERERLTKENAQLVVNEQSLKAQQALTETQLKKTEADLKQADRTRQDLAREVEGLREEKERGLVAVTRGSPLLKRPVLVPIGIGRSELSTKLLAMLTDLRQTVESVGVEVPIPAADKVDRDLITPIYVKIQQMAGVYKDRDPDHPGLPAPKQVFIRPTSMKNRSKGEKLSTVNFEVQPNRTIYRKGDEIAHTPVDGRLPQGKILQQLFNFDTRIQEEMQKKGILEESLQYRLGKISVPLLIQFMKIAERAQELNQWVNLRLVASSDIVAYGPIDASYQLAPASGPPRAFSRTTTTNTQGSDGVEVGP